jgi:hypothetical protein
MNKTLAILTAGAFSLASVSAFADDTPPANVTPADQAKTKEQADAQKASDAQAEALKYQDTMDKATQDPQGRNIGITKAAADAKAAKAKTDAAMAKMTPEQKAAAKKAKDAETMKYQDAMDNATQNPQGRNAGIAKSAADSKAGPTPRHGTMNTPEADKILREQKGQ